MCASSSGSSSGVAKAEAELARTLTVLRAVAKVGRDFPSAPMLQKVAPLAAYFDGNGRLIERDLDLRDGGVTRREAMLRMLLLSAVIDQGPDIEGVRQLAVDVVNDLYAREVRILHRPLDFFQHFHLSATSIEECHTIVKSARAAIWADRNESNAAKYLLYMENARQTLGYAIYRWGAPLAVAMMLAQEAHAKGQDTSNVLSQHLRGRHDGFAQSVEGVTSLIKDHNRYGLGKAIGDKAAHLFGKWVVHSFPLLTTPHESAWSAWSYEVPFDSNAGRVLYRTGIISGWVDEKRLKKHEVIQPGAGKDGKAAYMRVTNLRGVESELAQDSLQLVQVNRTLCVDHLRTHRRAPQKVQAQHIPSIAALIDGAMTPGEIDDGLIKVGTEWCFNTGNPRCPDCPLRSVCAGARDQPKLITDVRT
jgi:hypothetical protein